MEWTATELPNWRPLEANVPLEERPDYMHMGACGTIQLYKHRDTRRYLNIDGDCARFYLCKGGELAEVDRESALLHMQGSITRTAQTQTVVISFFSHHWTEAGIDGTVRLLVTAQGDAGGTQCCPFDELPRSTPRPNLLPVAVSTCAERPGASAPIAAERVA